MASSTPRKFSEKIAIMERKQNEDVNTFEDIMREVRSITNTNEAPGGVPIPGQLQPPSWPHPHLGGSLPNVAQLHNYGPPNWQQWEHQRAQRSRSPEAHFHPYRATGRSPDRVPPLHPHYAPYPPQHTLHPPDSWHQINRARSDPNIHQSAPIAPMHPMYGMIHQNHFMHQMQPGPSGIHPGALQMPPHMTSNSLPTGHLPPQMTHPMQSPMQSPVQHMMPGAFPFTNGSPMQSPMGSPMGSTIMLDETRTTPMMELSPPGMMQDSDQGNSMSNLPNLPQIPPNCYHATVGQRHSTGQCGRLVPGPPLTPESQSAPTSPANVSDPSAAPQWPSSRTFSNSPESMDIPRVVLTNPDGAHGQHFDCYNDLQHLTLDSNEMASLCNGSGNVSEHPIL